MISNQAFERISQRLAVSKMNKKWYVHDEYDCFADFDLLSEAAVQAMYMTSTLELSGVHIVYMSPKEHAQYCNSGKLIFFPE